MDFDFPPITEFPDPVDGIGRVPVPRRPETPPVRPLTRSGLARRRTFALCAAVLYECAWLWIFNKRGDLSSVPATTLIAELTIPLAAAAVAMAAATARGPRGLGATKARLIALALMAPLVFVTATLFAGPADLDRESFWPHALRCFLVTAVLGLGPLGLAVWSFRRTFLTASAWRMAALGMACAACAAAGMSLICSVGRPAHVLVGHGGLILVAGIGGALLGRPLGQA
jgi:hypothetical protein